MSRHPSSEYLFSFIPAISVLLFVCAEPVPAFGGIVDSVERTFSVGARPRIVLINVDGRSKITAGASSQVRVKAVKEVLNASSDEAARSAAERVKIRIEQTGDRVEIEAIHPRTFSILGKADVRVHFAVIAPSSSDVQARGVDGAIEIEGMDGRLELKSVDGNISAFHCAGTIEANSVDGELTISGARGDVLARTTDGKITIEGNLRTLNARSTDGSIDVTAYPDSEMTGEWSLRTTDGDVRIRLPEGFAADLDAGTSDGTIRSEHPVTPGAPSSAKRVSGRLRGGGRLLSIHTSDGNIAILR